MVQPPFRPHEVYAPSGGADVPRVLNAPGRYLQAPGALAGLGRYVRGLLSARRAGVLVTEGGSDRVGGRIDRSLEEAGIERVRVIFGGDCSPSEIERVTRSFRDAGDPVDCLVALGGGKLLDAGKSVAYRLGVPVVTCPTIASTDAPCSAVSVIYGEDGVFEGVEHFPESPALVVVDTAVIAAAPPRYLVAGMGDALATGYEARTCVRNPAARTIVGGRMTVAALRIAEASAQVVIEDGVRALEDVRAGRVTDAVERVVEANTLLSGVGFEGGGIAAAHAVATVGLARIDSVRDACLHGEMVAIGLLTQLVMEDDAGEALRVAGFMAEVGLPVHLGHLGLDPEDDRPVIEEAARRAADSPLMANEPFEVTAQSVLEAMLGADGIGRALALDRGADQPCE